MNNDCFWKEFYKNKNDIEPSQFSQFIYQDFLKKYNDDSISLKIADIGCGNCLFIFQHTIIWFMLLT